MRSPDSISSSPVSWGRVASPVLFLSALAWCFALVAARCAFAGTSAYAFLVWNLFLATVPLGFAFLLERSGKPGERPVRQSILLAAWLLFFPNAPYILTDLIHLVGKASPLVPKWYDLAMLLSFAFAGLIIGFSSLDRVQRFLVPRIGLPWSWAFVGVVMFLCGFGIYLGRFLRWNSWDIMARPMALFADIADRVIHPFDHPRAVLVTGIFGVFLLLAYLGFQIGVGQTSRDGNAGKRGFG